MLCTNCLYLAFMYSNKKCIRCNSDVTINISVLCEQCSLTSKSCAVCLKKIVNHKINKGGCGCGKK